MPWMNNSENEDDDVDIASKHCWCTDGHRLSLFPVPDADWMPRRTVSVWPAVAQLMSEVYPGYRIHEKEKMARAIGLRTKKRINAVTEIESGMQRLNFVMERKSDGKGKYLALERNRYQTKLTRSWC